MLRESMKNLDLSLLLPTQKRRRIFSPERKSNASEPGTTEQTIPQRQFKLKFTPGQTITIFYGLTSSAYNPLHLLSLQEIQHKLQLRTHAHKKSPIHTCRKFGGMSRSVTVCLGEWSLIGGSAMDVLGTYWYWWLIYIHLLEFVACFLLSIQYSVCDTIKDSLSTIKKGIQKAPICFLWARGDY